MMKFITFITLLFFSYPLFSTEFNVGTSSVRSAYDGDSFNIAFRLAHIDAPEIKGKCEHEKILAIQSRNFVRHYFKENKKIQLKVVTVGKYGRPIVEVRAESGYLNQLLLDKGLARPYDGSRKSWCE
ncbi:MAG: thermonuclease family protein [Gammaproteobacteria bacterium]|nr:thermonuclease family protein [Gammaproteobacteria bacterium]